MTHVELRHYFHCDRHGSVHVDTLIDGELWQHHVRATAHWRELVENNSLVPDLDCDCDLLVGQVLERDGRIWKHPQFV